MRLPLSARERIRSTPYVRLWNNLRQPATKRLVLARKKHKYALWALSLLRKLHPRIGKQTHVACNAEELRSRSMPNGLGCTGFAHQGNLPLLYRRAYRAVRRRLIIRCRVRSRPDNLVKPLNNVVVQHSRCSRPDSKDKRLAR